MLPELQYLLPSPQKLLPHGAGRRLACCQVEDAAVHGFDVAGACNWVRVHLWNGRFGRFGRFWRFGRFGAVLGCGRFGAVRGCKRFRACGWFEQFGRLGQVGRFGRRRQRRRRRCHLASVALLDHAHGAFCTNTVANFSQDSHGTNMHVT